MTRSVLLRDIVNTLEKFASSKLAEDWDNVGLLLEPTRPHYVNKLFLTNDLTEDVLDEAINKKADMILSYHPPLFTSIKKITQEKWKDRIIVKAAENRIAIYSPHTSFDVIKGGVNDWLISCFDGDTSPLVPNNENPENGIGRLCHLTNPLDIDDVISKVKDHLNLNYVRVAYAKEKKIASIASVAGSGASILRGIKADLFLTGEMSHHDILDTVSNNTSVILCEHSNTERGFLKLLAPNFYQLLNGTVDVIISEKDRDPINIV